MRSGRFAAVLLLALPALAANPDPFSPPVEGELPDYAAPGAAARYAESLAIARDRTARDAGDVEAWERVWELMHAIGRDEAATLRVRAAMQDKTLPVEKVVGLKRLLGHLLVERFAGGLDSGNVIIQQGGAIVIRINPGGGGNARKLLEEALSHLADVLALHPEDDRSRLDLDRARRSLAGEQGEEVNLAPPEPSAVPAEIDLDAQADQLCEQASAMETDAAAPDMEGALALRRQALVLRYCTRTIPFAYDAALFEPVSRLAPGNIVNSSLTRNYRNRKSEVQAVPPVHYPTPPARRVEIVKALAARGNQPAAVAALLALIRWADGHDEAADAAVAALALGRPATLVARLPSLLESTEFPAHNRRRLIRLAAALRLREAAPLLLELVPFDRDLTCPLDAALALGSCGGPEEAGPLAKLAQDATADVYFRRRAIDALSLLAPGLLQGIAPDPLLDVALAAAKYRAAPDDATRGRILNMLEDDYLADDAAAYCVELKIREAVPLLDEALARRRDHYLAEPLREALDALR